MRLIDLEPSWAVDNPYADPAVVGPLTWQKRIGMGITFRCPHCKDRLGIFFSNPVDGLPPAKAEKLWSRVGGTFETLTVHPSIDVSKDGHWHGHITNGLLE